MLHDSNHVTFWRRQNYGDGKKVGGGQGLKTNFGNETFLEEYFPPTRKSPGIETDSPG